MSGFNAMFSLGGIVGAGGVTLFIVAGLSVMAACGAISICLGMLFLVARGGLLGRTSGLGQVRSGFVWPRGKILVIGVFCFGLFLCEGAVLDWSAIYLTEERDLSNGIGGIGYALFSGFMMAGRFAGDRAVLRFGDAQVMIGGSLLAATGYAATIFGPSAFAAIAGFGVVGLGLANMVPILFRAAGNQVVLSPGLAIAAVSTCGYAGILVGPALIGLVIETADFKIVLASMALLLLAIAFSSVRLFRAR